MTWTQKATFQTLSYLGLRLDLAREGARQLGRVLGVGMSADMWTSIGDTMVAHVNTRKGSALRLSRALHGRAARSRELALQQICQSLLDGQPVLAMLNGALGHFTAIAGCTQHRLRLFDSSGFHWIEIRSIAVASDAPRRHQIHPEGVLKIVDDW